jgi:hypothetical protein
MPLTQLEFEQLTNQVAERLRNNEEITAQVAREILNATADAFTRNPSRVFGLALDPYNFDRVCFHLGYSVGSVPAGDYARLIEATSSIPSDYYFNQIIAVVERCERAYRLTELANPSARSRLEQISGDTDRTLAYNDYKQTSQIWKREYLDQTNELAQLLWVANYRDPEVARYRFERSGAEFIQAIPGPPDVSVSTRFWAQSDWR